MMILSQDGMVAVNSDNVVMFEVKESETLPRETRLCATILITNGARFSRSIGAFRSTDRAELASSRWTTFRSVSAPATRALRRFRPKMK